MVPPTLHQRGQGFACHLHRRDNQPHASVTTAPHLQVNIAHPLEHPLVGPDHGVCVLCFTAGSALLEDLGDGEQAVS